MNDFGIIVICLITFPFILFVLRIIILSWKYFLMSRQLKAMEQQSARQQAQDAYLNTSSTLNINSDSSCHMGSKSADYPPAYDSVIQPHLNVTTNGEGGANVAAATTSSANISNGVSTITIETDIPSNAASNVDLPNASNTTQAAAGSAPAPSTTTIIDISANEKLNDHSTV